MKPSRKKTNKQKKLRGAIAIASVSLLSSPSVEVGPGSPSRTE